MPASAFVGVKLIIPVALCELLLMFSQVVTLKKVTFAVKFMLLLSKSHAVKFRWKGTPCMPVWLDMLCRVGLWLIVLTVRVITV